VRHLVELHGGTVSAFSGGQNQGSTFTVKLPLMIRNTASREAYSSRRKQVLGESEIAFDSGRTLEGLNLLVVEDEPDARELIATIFRGHKAEVRGVASPEEAMNLLVEWRPDVLVSDIEMPGEDGYSLIRKVRASEANRGTRMPAVALTAHARVDDRMRALSAGYDVHIAKPVEPAELIMVVANLARRSGA
jgi:CheY-like chemotaxis protein